MKIGLLFLLICYQSVPLAKSESIIVVKQENTSNFVTQRIWFCVSNKNYTIEGSELSFVSKGSVNSSEKTFLIQNQKNWDGGMYYFVDIPITHSMFKILSIKQGKILQETKWVYNILPTKLYEVWDESNIIRTRNADVHSPDAYILTLFLSAYLSNDPSYENGYSAYRDIQKSWLSFYSGATNGNLENTYFYDYSDYDYLIKDQLPPKTVLKSAKEKINELENSYNELPRKESITVKKNKTIGLLFLMFSCVVSTFVWLLMRRKALYGKKK